jgi:formate hydrogenlyase subunit 4
MCCAAAIVPSLATALPRQRRRRDRARRLLRTRARIHRAGRDGYRHVVRSLGARREMFIGFLAEPALLMVLFTASLIRARRRCRQWLTRWRTASSPLPSLAFAGVAFTMVSLAKTRASPSTTPQHTSSSR